ncbi:helicase SKI2W [Acrasis kona]|uniref:Helicase SKI2W n=1 Tax=Acrasis kona TaxID=1008807 RepID=A0AAW2YWV0_9EUKA
MTANARSEQDLSWLVGERGALDDVDPETLDIIPYSPENDNSFFSKKNDSLDNQKQVSNLRFVPENESNVEREVDVNQQDQSENTIHVSDDSIGILDSFAPTSRGPYTRRAASSLNKSNDPLESYAPKQPKPSSLQELYESTLPNVRNQLRQEGLRQTGFVKPKSASSFESKKYKRNKKTAKHDPFKPSGALRDPSLQSFTPEQWTGDYPDEAQDDIIRAAINGLRTNFQVQPKVLYRGDPILYVLKITTSAQIAHATKLQVIITVVHQSKTLLRTERSVVIQTSNPRHEMRGELGLSTSQLQYGSHQVYAQVFLLSEIEKILLSSHGPEEVIVSPRSKL